MRERIARALALADGKDPDAPAWVRLPGGHPEGVCWRDQYSRKADAVLAAMREPDMAAIMAADDLIEPGAKWQVPPRKVWRAMIDAEIAESGDTIEPPR